MNLQNIRRNSDMGTTIGVGYSAYLLIRLLVFNIANYPHATFGPEVLYVPLLLCVTFMAWRWHLLGGMLMILIASFHIWLTYQSWIVDTSLNKANGWIIGDYYYAQMPLNIVSITVFALYMISGILHVIKGSRKLDIQWGELNITNIITNPISITIFLVGVLGAFILAMLSSFA